MCDKKKATQMVDSCFKLFRSKWYRRECAIRDSNESIFENEKCAINSCDKKFNFDINTTTATVASIDNAKKVKADREVVEAEQVCLDVEHVVLRRHNRAYLRSISTTTSNDAISSDDDVDDDENLDILYPLPRDNTHERPLEEGNRQNNVDIGMKSS